MTDKQPEKAENFGGRRRCEFQLLRYVPDVSRNEFVHIGVILREAGSEGPPEVRLTNDWRRVRSVDPDADVELLEAVESDLRQRYASASAGRLIRLLDEALSLGVQMSEPKAYLAESVPAGVEELMRIYVDPRERARQQKMSGRTMIQTQMRRHFEQAGVWALLRKRIAASEYTRAGDPLRIDAGYRPNGVIRMFQAVSLDAGAEAAKVLAYSAPALTAGVARVEGAQLELTAIVETAAKVGATEADPERRELYRFGIETMEENQIRVLTTEALGEVADRARRELQV